MAIPPPPPSPSAAEIAMAKKGKVIKRGQYTYNYRSKRWILTGTKPTKPTVPAPPSKNTIDDNLKNIVKTNQEPTFIEAPIIQFDMTEADLKNAYQALSTSELFLFLNNQSIEGYEFNYGINAGLNSVRRGYKQESEFGSLPEFIKNVYIANGQLVIEFYDIMDRMDLVIEFYTQYIEKIDSHDH